MKGLQTRAGITFIFVTHDQEEALTMSDRIAVMNGGRIEQLGAAAEVYRQPATAFVADFLGQANVLPATITARDAGGVTIETRAGLMFQLPAAAIPEASVGSTLSAPRRSESCAEPIPGCTCFRVAIDQSVSSARDAPVADDHRVRPADARTVDRSYERYHRAGGNGLCRDRPRRCRSCFRFSLPVRSKAMATHAPRKVEPELSL